MKKFLSISLVFLLAFVITYAGSGINAYSFCCDDCHSLGAEAVASNMCCDMHHHSETPSDNDTCDNSHDKCNIERLAIELQDISFTQELLFIKVLDIPFPTLPYVARQPIECVNTTGFITQSQKPPNMSEKTYFSLLETLII